MWGAMDAQRALLDSLLGTDRNAAEGDGASRRQSFKDDDVCKYFLVDECPHEMFVNQEGRTAVNSPIGACKKQHSEAMRERLKADRDYKKYYRRYLTDLQKELQRLVDDNDKKAKVIKMKLKAGDSCTTETQEAVDGHITARETLVSEKLAAAERMAEDGNMEASQETMKEAHMLAHQKYRLARLKEVAEAWMDDVCDICGSQQSWRAVEELDARDKGRPHPHTMGAWHQGWARVREGLRRVNAALQRVSDEQDSGSRERDRRSDMEREKENSKEGGRDNDRDQNRDKGRRRSNDKDINRQRDRDRDKDGAKDKDKDRNKDRVRYREREEDKKMFRELLNDSVKAIEKDKDVQQKSSSGSHGRSASKFRKPVDKVTSAVPSSERCWKRSASKSRSRSHKRSASKSASSVERNRLRGRNEKNSHKTCSRSYSRRRSRSRNRSSSCSKEGKRKEKDKEQDKSREKDKAKAMKAKDKRKKDKKPKVKRANSSPSGERTASRSGSGSPSRSGKAASKRSKSHQRDHKRSLSRKRSRSRRHR